MTRGRSSPPSVAPSALYDAGLPRDMPVVNDGTRILGVPVGSKEFQKSFVSAHLDALEDTFHTLGRVPNLQAQFKVAQRSLAHRSTHLFQTLFDGGDPAQYLNERSRYDALMCLVPKRIVGRPCLNQRASALNDLPLRHGVLVSVRGWRRQTLAFSHNTF